MRTEIRLHTKGLKPLSCTTILLTLGFACTHADRERPSVAIVTTEHPLEQHSGGATQVPADAMTAPMLVTQALDASVQSLDGSLADASITAHQLATARATVTATVAGTLPADPLPPEPVITITDPAVLARTQELRGVIEQLDECVDEGPRSRVPHAPAARCRSWIRQLERGGEAAAHAIGEKIRGYSGIYQQLNSVDEQLLWVFTELHQPAGVAYLVSLFHRLASQPPIRAGQSYVYLRDVFTAFETMTAFPINDVEISRSFNPAGLADRYRPVVLRALQWWHRVGATPAAWPTEADAQVRRWYSGTVIEATEAARTLGEGPEFTELRALGITALERWFNDPQLPGSERANVRHLIESLQEQTRALTRAPRRGR